MWLIHKFVFNKSIFAVFLIKSLGKSITPRFHQDRSLPFAQREKREETGSERETERQKRLLIIRLLFFY